MTNSLQSTHETAWFKKFDAALKALPPEDSSDIVRVVRDHLHQRVSQGHKIEEVFSAFGEASEYAARFRDEYILTRARESGKTLTMFSTVVQFARRSLIASIGLLFAVVFALLVAGSLACLMIKMVRPDLVGLWVDLPLAAQHRYVQKGPRNLPLRLGHDHIQFGYSNPAPQAPEMLGAWMFPSLLGLAVLGYLGLRWILSRTAF